MGIQENKITRVCRVEYWRRDGGRRGEKRDEERERQRETEREGEAEAEREGEGEIEYEWCVKQLWRSSEFL